jgi:hypothetical protein
MQTLAVGTGAPEPIGEGAFAVVEGVRGRNGRGGLAEVGGAVVRCGSGRGKSLRRLARPSSRSKTNTSQANRWCSMGCPNPLANDWR